MAGYIMELRKAIGSKPIILAGAGAILVDSMGRILLQHRTDNHSWGIPGGSMELGESYEETARREVFEETGLVVGELNLFYLNSGQHTFYQYPNGDEVYMACTIFTTTDFSGDIKMQEDETADLRWFHLHEIPGNINPNDRRSINKFAVTRSGS
ncbi:MAG: NUDIX hydrolase [Bacilli bacterium]